MRAQDDYISMARIRGDRDAKMCCLSSVGFREDVVAMAKKHGYKLQDFMLMALRDKVYADRKAERTVEGRRQIALEKLFQDKRAPKRLKDAIEKLLEDYLPKPNH